MLMLLFRHHQGLEIEFGWGGGGGMQTHFRVKPNSVEAVLRLSWGCGNCGKQNCAGSTGVEVGLGLSMAKVGNE